MLGLVLAVGLMHAAGDAPAATDPRSPAIGLCASGAPPDLREDAPLVVVEDEGPTQVRTLLAIYVDGTVMRRRPVVGRGGMLDGQDHA
jgi:hypothetical protein